MLLPLKLALFYRCTQLLNFVDKNICRVETNAVYSLLWPRHCFHVRCQVIGFNFMMVSHLVHSAHG